MPPQVLWVAWVAVKWWLAWVHPWAAWERQQVRQLAHRVVVNQPLRGHSLVAAHPAGKVGQGAHPLVDKRAALAALRAELPLARHPVGPNNPVAQAALVVPLALRAVVLAVQAVQAGKVVRRWPPLAVPASCGVASPLEDARLRRALMA